MTTLNLLQKHPNKKDVYKTVADMTKDFAIVESLSDPLDLDMDGLKLESVDTMVTSVAVSALFRN